MLAMLTMMTMMKMTKMMMASSCKLIGVMGDDQVTNTIGLENLTTDLGSTMIIYDLSISFNHSVTD